MSEVGLLRPLVGGAAGTSPLACPMCRFTTSCNLILNQHVRRHHDGWPSACPHCDYRTHRSHDLKKHLRTHTGEKPYHCSLCSYQTSDPSNLSAHLKNRHAAIRVEDQLQLSQWSSSGDSSLMPGALSLFYYRCPHCPFMAGSRKRLRGHLSAHAERRAHSCNYCDYRATCNKDLQKHIRTHTGEKPYQCELCPYRASDPSNYRAHLKLKHKDRVVPQLPQHSGSV
ncbi:hypothetical protein Pcinc_033221 [Petrolisthes cinctipes]|uniref:C2H2-type domain-containing protein n=1 Tax=Petrolisthes cinctipes TaxID=88211 RepID=A0AAE1JZ67_PETCI|nr:hypothetical protein Pcinc_033221 [Petrolisthes cinctipes]